MTHICVSKLNIICSFNGLSPGRRQAIIWTNVGILLIGPLGTNFIEILIEILTFSFKKMRLKLSSAKRLPFCLGHNVLIHVILYPHPKLRDGFSKEKSHTETQFRFNSFCLKSSIIIHVDKAPNNHTYMDILHHIYAASKIRKSVVFSCDYGVWLIWALGNYVRYDISYKDPLARAVVVVHIHISIDKDKWHHCLKQENPWFGARLKHLSE